MHKPEPNIDTIIHLKKVWQYFFEDEPKTIFEFGARYCEDTICISENFKQAQIYSFECNPNTIHIAKDNIKGIKNIKLIETAVGNKDGKEYFYPINKEKTTTTWVDGNQGASSLFEASGNYPIEQYVQDKIEVSISKPNTILNKLDIKQVDILWMDIQGAELQALQGFEDKLQSIKLIHTEVEFFEIYKNQPLFRDLKSYLIKNGFVFYCFTNLGDYSGDAIFLNYSLVKRKLDFTIRLKYLLHKLLNYFLL